MTAPATRLVLPLDDPAADLALVGGKGASLSRLAAAGLPVPPGFHVTTEAYRRFVGQDGRHERILGALAEATAEQPVAAGAGSRPRPGGPEAAAERIAAILAEAVVPDAVAVAIRKGYAAMGGDAVAVAVRSSATAEDLPDMSFAGQQETYLNIRGEDELLAAVQRCWASLWTARAIGYRARNDIPSDEVALAVVVQELVPADAAGVMFTADPLTGARERLLVNAAWGLGEAVVGGAVTPDTYAVDRTSGSVLDQQVGDKTVMTVRTARGTRDEPVPPDLRRAAVLDPDQATELARIGVRVEELYDQPMDIEWAAHDGRFFVLQARPITGLRSATGPLEEWNDSLRGDYLWTCANLGEAIPSVMTPSTWSLVRIFMAETMAISSLGPHPGSGTIGGRFYLNLSLNMSAAQALGLGALVREASVQAFGHLPDGLEVPPLPLSRWRVLWGTLAAIVPFRRRVAAYQKRLPELLAAAPERCAAAHAHIAAAGDAGELRDLWHSEIDPLLRDASRMLAAGARLDGVGLIRIRPQLRKLVGEADANALLTGLHTSAGELASLGPLLGLGQLARGEIDRATYTQRWGHRCPDEFEVSRPRPAEDPAWIDRQLAGLRTAKEDATTLLARQETARDAAWERFSRRYPRRVAALRRRTASAGRAARAREAARSEVIRTFWVLRAFVLRAGEVTGHGEDLFLLAIEEVLAVIGGDDGPLAAVPVRRATYEHYRALPAYPTLIRGPFDPDRWAADPDRRGDLFDEGRVHTPVGDAIAGFPGAAGVVEGTARVIVDADDGDQLQPGEVLVTTVTNVGWTPIFPRAAAVVTDIGAPLSHAAIVARELGIPAVVGCGNATVRIHSGDRVRVDGEHGTVDLLVPADQR